MSFAVHVMVFYTLKQNTMSSPPPPPPSPTITYNSTLLQRLSQSIQEITNNNSATASTTSTLHQLLQEILGLSTPESPSSSSSQPLNTLEPLITTFIHKTLSDLQKLNETQFNKWYLNELQRFHQDMFEIIVAKGNSTTSTTTSKNEVNKMVNMLVTMASSVMDNELKQVASSPPSLLKLKTMKIINPPDNQIKKQKYNENNET
jgi:hypothetical protein